MFPDSRADRWFVGRVTLLIGVPFSLLYTWAYVYGGDREKLPILVFGIVATFLVSFALAWGTWYFVVRRKRKTDKELW